MKKISTLAFILLATINIVFGGTTSDKNFKNDLIKFTNTYLSLKNAMVNGDLISIDDITSEMVEDVQDIDMEGFNSKNMDQWHNSIFSIKSELASIINSKDIETKRIAFSKLSEALIKTLTTFKTGQELYVTKCSMFEGGSYWIDNTKAIKNPFYGKSMLTCGSIIKTL